MSSTQNSMHARKTTFTFTAHVRIVIINKSKQTANSFTLKIFDMPVTDCDVFAQKKFEDVTFTSIHFY